jgi:hypothetical protein
MKINIKILSPFLFAICLSYSCKEEKINKVVYLDSSRNEYILTLSNNAKLEYKPMTSDRSSSGFYNGGEPKEKELTESELQKIIKIIISAETNKKAHIITSIKGNGVLLVYRNDKVKRYDITGCLKIGIMKKIEETFSEILEN